MKNIKIMTIKMDGIDYKFKLKKIDSTHFKCKNLTLNGDYVVYHISQFIFKDYYDEINRWLHSQN